MRCRSAAGAAGVLVVGVGAAAQEKTAYSIASAQSKLEIHVYKEGMFKAFGHDHLIAATEISGEAQLDAQKIEDSTVRLQIATKSLTVVDPGESEKDRRDVQATKGSEKGLELANSPATTFTSSRSFGA